MGREGFERNLARTYGAQALSGIAKALLPIVVARQLGPTDFGEFSVAVAAAMTAFSLGNLGMSPAMTVGVAGGGEADRPSASDALSLSLLLGGCVLVAAMAVVALVPSTTSSATRETVLVALLALPGLLVLEAVTGLLLGSRRYRAFNTFSMINQGGRLLAVALAAWMIGTALGVVAAWTSMIFGLAVAGAVLVDWSSGIRVANFRPLLRFGVLTHLSNLAMFLNYRLDLLLIAAILDAREAGIYAAGVVIAEALWFFSQPPSLLLLPEIASLHDPRERRELTDTVSRIVFWPTVLLAGLLALAADPVLRIVYSTEYTAAASSMRILLVGVVALSLARVFANHVAALGKPGLNIWGSAPAVLVNVALNLWLIPRYGIEGAAIASTISYTLTLVVQIGIYAGVERQTGRLTIAGFARLRRSDVDMVVDALRRRRER